MTDESKALLQQIKLALKAEKDSAKLMADTIKASEKAEKDAEKVKTDGLLADLEKSTTVNQIIKALVKYFKKEAK